MDIYSIKENLPALEEIGCTISTSQRLKLQMGLLKLTDIAKSDQLLFWGKIFTTGQPYYIAQSIDFKDHYAFPHKKFFWSSSNMQFKQLPALDTFYKQKVGNFFHLPFTGDPAQILINVQGQQSEQKKEKVGEGDKEDSEEQQKVKVAPKNLTQADRLSYTVNTIEIECQVLPVGSLRMTQKHQLRYNDRFRGLKLSDVNLCNFQRFRYPQSRTGKERIEKPQSVFVYDFLEPIENESEWSIQTNSTNQLVTLRNLIWQGYVGYHWVGSSSFGGIYFGNGIKGIEMPFFI